MSKFVRKMVRLTKPRTLSPPTALRIAAKLRAPPTAPRLGVPRAPATPCRASPGRAKEETMAITKYPWLPPGTTYEPDGSGTAGTA